MKKIILTGFAFFFACSLKAQTTKEIKPLTPAEVSKRLISKYSLLAFAPITKLDYENIKSERKKQASSAIPKLSNEDSLTVSYLQIPGLNQGDPEIPIRIYKPKKPGKAPIFLWFHGGGFVYGSLNWDHQNCANIAVRAGVVVISVDYRLAPENKFPAGVNDAYATFLWSKKHAAEIGGDADHIGLGGGSAGAGIAGSMVLVNRDKKGPKIDFQVLFFPPADVDTNRISVRELWNIPGVKGADIPVLLKMYLGDEYQRKIPVNALPGLAKSFEGLPPTYIATCGVDPLRDGGLVYGQNLIAAGIPVELHNFPGYPHGLLPDKVFPEVYDFMHQYYK
ncbi:acetyl esterase/lipase [Pedobacter sp. AK013]|uniref:alpha/beta hydrolase n=1 Tax=Pedobacter sp. AK013 TaxID=2723071 RepID=UPI001611AC9A|nr:alpha/beta hydrolase [Pedobacter sp. AK013]MBB6236823.1 acetyl esterase/lipase [Pedobacter sp. AK013]